MAPIASITRNACLRHQWISASITAGVHVGPAGRVLQVLLHFCTTRRRDRRYEPRRWRRRPTWCCGRRRAVVAVIGGGPLTFLVEQARQTTDLELAIEQKISARDDVVALAQSAEHEIGV